MRLLLPRVTTWWYPGLSSRNGVDTRPTLAAPTARTLSARSLVTVLRQFVDGGSHQTRLDSACP